jgi:hypothetical protein
MNTRNADFIAVETRGLGAAPFARAGSARASSSIFRVSLLVRLARFRPGYQPATSRRL